MAGKATAKMAAKMAAKKAKAPAKAAAKQDQKKGAKADKGGALGSLKKMLGLSAGKAPAATGKASAKGAALPQGAKGKAAPTGKGAAAAAKEKEMPQAKGKGAAPQAGKAAAPAGKGAKGAPTAVETKKGKGAAMTGPLGDLRPSSLKPQEPLSAAPPVCREVACELMATTGGYCRMHYIKNWKKIKRKQMILQEKKLNSYIEELVSKYPDKYIEAIRQDLASEKDFAKVIADLEIEEGLDDFESVETEGAEGIIDNLKRDFDDEGDVF